MTQCVLIFDDIWCMLCWFEWEVEIYSGLVTVSPRFCKIILKVNSELVMNLYETILKQVSRALVDGFPV